MNILEIQHLNKTVNHTQILHNINLDVIKGEILTLVGPSGSGKSTLLRCINRLIEPDSGLIKYNGTNITTMMPHLLRRSIVLVPQESIMFPGTVKDNIAYGAKLQQTHDDPPYLQSLSDVGLSESFLDQQAATLSGGEKKRVALARALAIQPDIILLDEPTAGVDPKNIETVEQRILSFSKERNLTVLWVTHHVEQAKRVSTRIANVKDGTITTIASAHEFQWEVAY